MKRPRPLCSSRRRAAGRAAWASLVPALDPLRFPLDTVGEADRAIEGGTGRGTLVIDIGDGERP